MKIVKQACESCSGTGRVRCVTQLLGAEFTGSRPCEPCDGTGTRFVPEGYSQRQVEVVRHLVDALAVQQGVA